MEKKHRDPGTPDLEAAESPENSAGAETLSAAERLGQLEEQVKQLEQEKKSLFDQLVRRQADFDNFRKRMEREQREARRLAEADLVAALLPVLDAFERALAAPATGAEEYRKGVELIYKQLSDTLRRAGLSPVEAVGKIFDPFLHHAVERVESAEHADQEVVEELQRGYTFKERLLRPALVRVAVAPSRSAEEAGSPENLEAEE